MKSLLLIILSVSALCTQTENFSTFLPTSSLDDPRIIVGSSYISSVPNLPTSGRCPRSPWAGDYWAWRYGGISARYVTQDTRYRSYATSIGLYSQPSEHNARVGRTGYQDYVNRYYSAAEKYDLLVGDYNFGMTNYNKRYGARFNGGGDIPTWYGICHGLAPAAWMFPEPRRSVSIQSPLGITINFYQDDLKALGSLFWAFASYNTRLVGRRDAPVHPATFYIIFSNWVGLRNKNINFEPIADNEIWNFAVDSYSTSYYSVNNQGYSTSYTNGLVTLNQARVGTSLARQAAANATSGTYYILGVIMRINYIGDISASYYQQTKPVKSITYNMILYLQANGEILNGYWLSVRKPSYVWGPLADVQGPYDSYVSGLNDPNLTYWARRSSSAMMPLRKVIDELFRLASQ